MKLIAVVVLYDCDLEKSNTLNTLNLNFLNNKIFFKSFKLVIYDNGLLNQENKLSIPFNHVYYHDSRNIGLISAYNFALNEGVKNQYDWLLLLDQDSSLPKYFISSVFSNIAKVSEKQNIQAVVPKMRGNGKVFSPSKVIYGGIHRPVEDSFTGVYNSGDLCPIGSASALRISFIKEKNILECLFKTDCLDRWIFYSIHKNNGKVYIFDLIVDHELSVMDYSKLMSLKRYKNVIKYETIFIKLYKTKGEFLIYYLRLLFRTLIFLKRKNTFKFVIPTINHLLQSIFLTKNKIYNENTII